MLTLTLLSLVLSQGTASGLPGLPSRAFTSPNLSIYLVTDGGYQTGLVADTYFVDPTGSDSNACTSSGAAACATLTGITSRLPRFIRNTITINVAAGTYTDAPIFDGTFENAGNIDIVGPTLTGFTVATGSNSGSWTAVNNVQPATFTDSTQTWTTDNLKGALLVFTNGTSSGGILPIIGNTATVITTGASIGGAGPSVGNTYQIRIPAASFTNSTASGFGLTIRMFGKTETPIINSNGRFRITGVDFLQSGASGVACNFNGDAYLIALAGGTRCRQTNAGVGLQMPGGVATIFNSIIQGGSVGAIFGMASAGTTAASVSNVSTQRTGYIGGTSSGRALVLYNSLFSVQIGSLGLRSSPSSAQGVFEIHGRIDQISTNQNVLGIFCDSAGYGFYAGDASGSPLGSLGQGQTFTAWNFYVSGCGVGVGVSGKLASVAFDGTSGVSTCNNIANTCLEIALAGQLRVPTSLVVTGSSPTNQITLDTVSYTVAQLLAASPRQITAPLSFTTVHMR